MAVKFIVVTTGFSLKKTISVDNIASVEHFGLTGSKITLKEVKNGNNVEITCLESVNVINNWLSQS